MAVEEYKAKQHYQRKDVANAYEDRRFTSWHGRLAHKAEARAMRHVIESYYEPGSTVLDIPCGTGRLLSLYGETGLRVTGCDISEEMLAFAKRRFRDDPLFSFQICEAEALPFADNSFDNLTSFRFVAHLPAKTRRRVLAEMIRVTRSVLAINYYFNNNSPLMIINRVFRRKDSYPPYRVKESSFGAEVEGLDVEVCEIRKLSWYERNSALVIMRKNVR